MNKKIFYNLLIIILLICTLSMLIGCSQSQLPDVPGTAGSTTASEDTEPPTTQEVTEPEVTESEVTEPEVTEPEVTEPEVTEPEVTEPEVTEPEVTEPEVTEPEVTELEVTEPEVTEPPVVEPQLPAGVVKPPVLDGKYQISKPEHLRYMQLYPDQDYILCADIDMGGAIWKPIDTFTGTLNGEIYDTFNYTISNFTLQASSADANVGFFRVLSGTVRNVIFKDVTVACSGTFSGNLGIVAGAATKILEDLEVKDCTVRMTVSNANVGMLCGKLSGGAAQCDAAGVLDITLAGGTSYIGGGYGYVTQTLATGTIRTNVTVSGSGTTGAAGGVVGYIAATARNTVFSGRLHVTADASLGAGAVAGHLATGKLQESHNAAQMISISGAANASEFCGIQAAGTTVTDCLIRDRNYTEAKLSDAEYAIRMQAVEYMYNTCTVRWIPSKTLTYTDGCANDHSQTYYKGQVYFGLPYTHRTGSYERFMHYLNADGTVSDEVPAKGFQAMLGNDCCDAVYWAWSQFSADITFVKTHYSICTNGTIPVGNYQVANNTSTKDTCKLNGAQVMYEAYACVQPGDALLYAPGHIRMAAEAAYVFRNADGSIDPNKSYILTHEQGFSCTKLDTLHTTCLAYGKYTFAKLFSGNYIPITMEAFGNGKADEIQVSTTNTDLTKSGLAKGTVSSNYRVNYVTLEITDANGKILLDAFGSPNVNDTHVTTYDLSTFKSKVNAVSLKAGQTYTYTVTLCVASQDVVVQTFQFVA